MKNRNVLTDHTLIINEIERSIKFYAWDLILSFLPNGSFLVGGYIRDIILGRVNEKVDVDIVVPSNAINIAQSISDKFRVKCIILDRKREVVRIIFNQISIDLANRVSSTIAGDLESRDLSINSIAYSFHERCLIDPLDGIRDIEFSVLKTFTERNLVEDPLRILRCFRFVSELNFEFDNKLKKIIIKQKRKLLLVARERINYEIQRIIRGQFAVESIILIKMFNLFDLKNTYKDSFYLDLKRINYENLNKREKKQFLPLFFLAQTLDQSSVEKFKFSKAEILQTKLLRKWQTILHKDKNFKLDEFQRFTLHQELEEILPSFIFHLPKKLQMDWLKRWRDEGDQLFHPSNLVTGDELKKYVSINDGPLLGQLLNYLSREYAYQRLDNFDEAIYKAKQWFEQNAPKCD